MPKVRQTLPPALFQLLDRIQSRKSQAFQLELLAKWLDTDNKQGWPIEEGVARGCAAWH